MSALRVRWLGTVDYAEAWDLQRSLFASDDDHLLLCEHPPVYTLGVRGDEAHLLADPTELGADVYRVDRGGDITFHGPGQLVGYPVVSVPGKRGGGMADTVAYVAAIEQLLIEVAGELGLATGRIRGCPGVWVEPDGPRPRKLAAVGVRLSRGRSMHGFALNVDVDLDWFAHMIPCGILDKGVTSLAAEGIDVSMREVVDLVSARAGSLPVAGGSDRAVERQDVAWRHRPDDLAPFSRGAGPGAPGHAPGHRDPGGVPVRLRGRLAEAGVDGGLPVSERKPPWMRVKLRTDPDYLRLKSEARRLDLVTVCEEAGCPNIFDCWNEGTATFMLLGDRCTRACGFCLIDTRRPLPVDHDEPGRVAEAVASLGLDYAVLTMVARDDLDDGGAGIVAATVEAIRAASPGTGIEVLISDLKGAARSLAVVCDARPNVVNHNIETVARLQRAVRPSASYARSLTVLARARAMGATTKSGLIVGMGERADEVRATLADLGAVGVEIVTIGQYLRPTSHHLPVHRWWTPDEFQELKAFGETELGIAHIEASPLTRSSHHAGSAAAAAGAATGTAVRG
jgi:lipoic acid synthetase